MTSSNPDVLICGAGMAGVAAAYELAVRKGVRNVTVIDEREPLTLTSDKGTEAYRNWWPGPDNTMVRFMNRSITLLEELHQESGGAFGMNRRGYVYLTGNPNRFEQMRAEAETVAGFGAGPVRLHPGSVPYEPSDPEGIATPRDGADLIADASAVNRLFPFVTPEAVGLLHARRCGWLNARALGCWLLERFREVGGAVVRGRVSAIEVSGDRLGAVTLSTGERLRPGKLVIAAGPLLHEIGALMGPALPVFHELHGKITLADTEQVIPPDSPMLIWVDPVDLIWTEEEKRRLAADPQRRWLTERFPGGVHLRPRHRDGKDTLLGIWTYDLAPRAPVWPLPFDPDYAESVIHGLAVLIPGMERYFGKGCASIVDGGYYCKTHDNRPLIGPLPVEGVYVIGALSGYGVMGSQAAAELLAGYLTGEPLPDYAPAFRCDRFTDLAYMARMARWDATAGQL